MTALQTLREKHPSIAVVVISATADRESVRRALDRGALGFIPKSSSNEVLRSALRLVLAGGIYIPPEILGRGRAAALASEGPETGGTTTPTDIGLTSRQAQILALVMKGQSNKVICRELNLGGIDCEEPSHGDPARTERDQPDAGGAGRRQLGLVLPRTRDEDRSAAGASKRLPPASSACRDRLRRGRAGFLSRLRPGQQRFEVATKMALEQDVVANRAHGGFGRRNAGLDASRAQRR